MRRFHSYGPVNSKLHFAVSRKQLVSSCLENLIGDPDEGGHYFTIWAPRQAGKTWLMQQVKQGIEKLYSDKYVIGCMSVQGVIMKDKDPEEVFFRQIPRLFRESFGIEPEQPENWDTWINYFSADKGLFEKPLILFIDEFDSLPSEIIDHLVTLFRDMYLKRDTYRVHGLALIGVRAVLGVESDRGSPFNIQRSLQVSNFTGEEVEDLYQQYQEESGQSVEPEVVRSVFEATRGQPGLVCWFGELLTEKYNPGPGKVIDMLAWQDVFEAALHKEWNNTVLNLIKKAQGAYISYVLELFTRPDMLFSIRTEWCSYLYLNGIIDESPNFSAGGKRSYACRFSSPFVQICLFNALTFELIGDRMPILALDPLDDLADVFEKPELNLPALLERYKNYLKRLKARGINPWKDQPRRADMHLTEAVGHFNLHAWLLSAVGRRCTVSPEFPTGNGRVDLHLRCREKRGIIEVKSFTNLSEAKEAKGQAAKYAKQTGLNTVTIALFVPVEDEDVLEQLSGEDVADGVKVTVKAIGWV